MRGCAVVAAPRGIRTTHAQRDDDARHHLRGCRRPPPLAPRAPIWRRGVRNGAVMALLALAAILLLNGEDLPGLGRVLAELPAGVAISAAVHLPQIVLTAMAWRALLPRAGSRARARRHGRAALVPRVRQRAAAGRRPGRAGGGGATADAAGRPGGRGRRHGDGGPDDGGGVAGSSSPSWVSGCCWPAAPSRPWPASPRPGSASPRRRRSPWWWRSATWRRWSACSNGWRGAGRRCGRSGSGSSSGEVLRLHADWRALAASLAVARRRLGARRVRGHGRARPARASGVAGRRAGDREPGPGAAQCRFHAARRACGAGGRDRRRRRAGRRAAGCGPRRPPWSGARARSRSPCPGLLAWHRSELAGTRCRRRAPPADARGLG